MGTQLNEFLNTFPWTDIKSSLMHILAAHSLFLAKCYESHDPAPRFCPCGPASLLPTLSSGQDSAGNQPFTEGSQSNQKAKQFFLGTSVRPAF